LKLIRLTPPLNEKDVRKLCAGDLVSITGTIVTARDKAYAKIVSGAKLPIKLEGGIVYHCGPLLKRRPSKFKIVSAGPTTSARMDGVQVKFLETTGVRAVVGKGGIGEDVAKHFPRLGCVYLAFPGGAGALAARRIEKIEGAYWRELGDAEAMWIFRVKDFGPLVVAVDTKGNSLYRHKNGTQKIKEKR